MICQSLKQVYEVYKIYKYNIYIKITKYSNIVNLEASRESSHGGGLSNLLTDFKEHVSNKVPPNCSSTALESSYGALLLK